MFISYTPSTVLVLPTSRTSSIRSPQERAHAGGNDDPQSFVGTYAKKAGWIEAIGDPAEAAVLIHVYQLTVCVGRTRLHPLDDGFKTKVGRAHRAGNSSHQRAIFAIERPHQRAHQLRSRPFFAGLDSQGGGGAAKLFRQGLVIYVDADADDRVLHARGFRPHLGENAGEFFFMQQQVIRPADIRLKAGDLFATAHSAVDRVSSLRLFNLHVFPVQGPPAGNAVVLAIDGETCFSSQRFPTLRADRTG